MSDEKVKYYRYDLTPSDQEYLFKLLNNLKDEVFKEEIKKILSNPKKIKETYLKYVAPQKANQTKIENSKKAIEEAKKQLKKDGKKITAYSISQISNISYNTAKKYLEY